MTLTDALIDYGNQQQIHEIHSQNEGTLSSAVLTALKLAAQQDYQIEQGEITYHSAQTIHYMIQDRKLISSIPSKKEVGDILEALVTEKIAERVRVTTDFRPFQRGAKGQELSPSHHSLYGYRIVKKQ